MGVLIPDDDFASIDVLRELNIVRGNLEDKMKIVNNTHDPDSDLFVTNGLGKTSPINLSWQDQDDVANNTFESSRSRSKMKLPKERVVDD
jgi:hypothetical protein